MKSSEDVLPTAHEDVQQQVVSDPADGRQRTLAEWTGDFLLGSRQPVRFRLADWP